MDKNELHNIKNPGFKVPKDYFPQVEEHILSEMELKSKVDTSGFNVPDSYFETIDRNILDSISEDNETKVINILSWRKLVYTTAIAASLILMFNLFMQPSETISIDDVETASIEHYLDNSEFSTYELASLLTEEEFNSPNFIENNIPDSSIEDYLIEHADLEDLITIEQ